MGIWNKNMIYKKDEYGNMLKKMIYKKDEGKFTPDEYAELLRLFIGEIISRLRQISLFK